MSEPDHPQPRNGNHQRLSGIRTVVLLYATFAALWILLSDRAVGILFSSPAAITLASTLKGWFFVLVTSILLYGLMRQAIRPSSLMTPRPPAVVSLRPLLLPVAILIVLIAGMTALSALQAVEREKNEAVGQLQTIAAFKVKQVNQWINERQADIRFVQGNQALARLYTRWQDTGDQASLSELSGRINRFRKLNAFRGFLLFTPQGRFVYASEGIPQVTASLDILRLAQVARTQPEAGVFTLHLEGGHPCLDFVASLPEAGGKPGAIVVLRVAPEDYLFPLMQTWPIPSTSGETLLARRDGDDVLYLNDLRFRREAALRLRLPLNHPHLLMAQVLQGDVALGEGASGVDYRQAPVLGVGLAVPGSDWFLLAKIDRAEVLAQARTSLWWIVLCGGLGIAVVLASAYLMRQRQELAFTLRERDLQEERLKALRLLDAIDAHSPDPIFVKDRQGRYLLFNQAAAKIVGQPAEQVLGKDDTAIFPPEMAQEIMARDQRLMREGGQETFQEALPLPGGGPICHLMVIKGALHDAEGQITGLFGVGRDVTELRETEEELRKSEAMFRSLFENMLNGFAYCKMLFEDHRPKDFVYLSVNRAFEVLTDLHDVVGRKVSEVIPGILERDPELLVRYGRVASGGPPERFELLVESLGIWFSIAVYCPHPEHFVAIFDVITERKQAEEKIRRTAQDLASAQAVAHVGSWRMDGPDAPERRLIWSEETYRIFDLTPGEPVTFGRFLTMIHPEDRERLTAARKAALTGQPFDVEYRIITPAGQTKWLHGQGELTPGPDGVPYLGVGAVQDITEHKQAEEERERLQEQLVQAQKMESVGRLAGGVAHDFNNMLSIIMGYTDLALTLVPPEGLLHANLQEIQTAAKRSAELTRQLLAFARKQVIMPRVLDLNQATEGMLKMLRRLIGEDIELIWRPDPGLWPVKVDASQIDQVLANLCVNARDAIAGAGQVTIATANLTLGAEHLAAHPDCAPGQYVRLSVTDTGIGMSPEVAARACEPFFTTKGVGKGTGLGLATVYGIAKQNRGWVSIESQPGQGAMVAVFLPRHQGEAEAVAAPIPENAVPLHSETVLVVEDEKVILQMIVAMLQKQGYQALAASSPVEALEMIKSGVEADLLLTDVIMPEMTGRELSERIAKLRPSLRCLYMSGYTAEVIGQHGVLADETRFIQKPFSQRELAAQVRAALDAG
ncbi:MAG: PAS domain S-box protein [Desulfobacteraceae bacterium]|nr:PAS domain S-box protein [Desulfobacteraceae bacterium]